MTLVLVDKQHPFEGWAHSNGHQEQVYVDVPIIADERDKCRKSAFRFVNKRREVDYQELATHARILTVESMTKEQFDMMFTHIN